MIPSTLPSKSAFRRQERERRREIWRAQQRRLFGSLGAAGSCRRIDPRTGETVEIVERRTEDALAPVMPGAVL
jgi:hypothetical protein